MNGTTAPKVTIKQNGPGADWREVHVDGVRVGHVSRKDYGRFGKSAWTLKLTGLDAPPLTEAAHNVCTLADAKAAVAEIFTEAK
jgi:hypothetical protein